jgi:hypothetical protein
LPQEHRGRDKNRLLVRSHIYLSVELAPNRKHDPHQAEGQQQGDDEQL